MMEKRLLEMRHSSEPWKVDEAWNKVRRGWCFGDDTFRKSMLERLDGSLESVRRDSVSGDEVAMHDEAEAERLVCLGLSVLNMEDDDLFRMIKSAPSKYAIAWLVRKHTSVRMRWIKDRLQMGSATNFSDYLRRIETARKSEWGHVEFSKIKGIKLSRR